MGRVQRQIVRGVLGVITWPRLTLAVAGAVLLACATLAYVRLDISTDTNELFNPDVPFFADYLAFDRKFPENEAVYAVIQARDAAHPPPPTARWTAAADAVAARVRALGGEVVRSVDARVPIERLGDQGLLFESPDKLADAVAGLREFVPLVRLWGEPPTLLTRVLGPTPTDRFLSGLLAQPPDAETARFTELLARSWTRTLADAGGNAPPALPNLASLDAGDPSRLGYYYVPDATHPARRLLLVRIYPNRTYDSLTALSATVEAIRTAVRAAAADFPEFAVGVTGRPALEADEMSTSDRDSRRAEVLALAVIFAGLVLFLRSVWLAVAAEISLGVGIGWTFGWAELAVGELNLLSIVFLIALIGIGMDYLVQILVRYRQEAARHAGPRAAWTRVFRHVGPPINTACLGAAGAFLVAAFTDFRGAAELGIIAGGGLLLCLLSGYTVLPALLTLFPFRPTRGENATARRREGERAGEEKRFEDDSKLRGIRRAFAPSRSHSPSSETAPNDRAPAGGRAGAWRLLLPAAWAILLLVGVLRYAPRTGFNPNLIELQAPNLESVQLVRKLQTFSAVVLSKDLDVLRRVRDAVKALPTVAATESIVQAYDNAAWLRANADVPAIDWTDPATLRAADLPRLARKAQALAQRFADAAPAAPAADRPALEGAADALGDFANRITALPTEGAPGAVARQLSGWQRGFVALLRDTLRQLDPGPPRVAELPPELRGHFVAGDGTAALYVYPREDLWDRDRLAQFVREIETALAAVPGAPAPTGIALNIHHTTAAIERSFYRSAAYALGLIVLLVLIDLRRVGQTLVAVSVLALGLPMLVALMGLLGVDWNFANFFGLPILIGAGHEYGVFMVHRYREAAHHPRRPWRRWDASDRALLLCAYVTCSSFGFFWLLAHHRGLKSLGLVMALGTACIYLATLLVVRPLLLWQLSRMKGA